MDTELKPLIERIADRYQLPPALVSALVVVESAGNPWAIRYEPLFYRRYVEKQPGLRALLPCSFDTERQARATSWGLLQIMGQVARERGFDGPFLSALCDPETGLDYGCKHLAHLGRRYFNGSWEPVIAAYNAGSPRQRSGLYVNQSYVNKVNAAYESFA